MAQGKKSALKSGRRWRGEPALKNIDFLGGIVMFLLLYSASILDDWNRDMDRRSNCALEVEIYTQILLLLYSLKHQTSCNTSCKGMNEANGARQLQN